MRLMLPRLACLRKALLSCRSTKIRKSPRQDYWCLPWRSRASPGNVGVEGITDTQSKHPTAMKSAPAVVEANVQVVQDSTTADTPSRFPSSSRNSVRPSPDSSTFDLADDEPSPLDS